jgi:hypothetical protein
VLRKPENPSAPSDMKKIARSFEHRKKLFENFPSYFPRKRKASFLEFIFEFILATKPTSNIDALRYLAVSI